MQNGWTKEAILIILDSKVYPVYNNFTMKIKCKQFRSTFSIILLLSIIGPVKWSVRKAFVQTRDWLAIRKLVTKAFLIFRCWAKRWEFCAFNHREWMQTLIITFDITTNNRIRKKLKGRKYFFFLRNFALSI